ncbi:MAG: DNA recombination protein RmuC [Candidatus Gracilibacteria bacterium]|nr:DNA recombination protein RmuC [Candidatus Gracilibacteria bacterium]
MSLEVLLIILISVLLFVIFLLMTKKENSQNNSGELKILQDQIMHLNKLVEFKLSESNNNISKNFEVNANISKNASDKIEEITKKLTSLEETNKQIQDIGGQLEGLEKILKNPKQRGILGEYILENVLKNILPPDNYKLQYEFKNGEIVDAAIFVKEKIIPIDSKFSLENYNRILESETKIEKDRYETEFRNDLKKRIDETSKYIKPEEGTMDFAFMFLPSEGIYYDLLVSKVGNVHASDLIEYAFKEKKVIIVSPTSFYAYLQTVMQGLRALKIEEDVKNILKNIDKLSKHLESYELYVEKMGKSLGTTVSHFNEASYKFKLIDKDVVKITNGESGGSYDSLRLEKPEIENKI